MADWVAGIIGVLGAVVGGAATQGFTLWRENKIGNARQARERRLIGAELIVRLRQFASNCEKVSNDRGIPSYGSNGEPTLEFEYSANPFSFETVKGDWSALPGELLLGVAELPLEIECIETDLAEYQDKVGEDIDGYFVIRQKRYGQLTSRIEALIEQLHRACDLPQQI